MSFAVSNRVVARNGIGQFIRDCEGAAEKTVRKSVQQGARLSRTLAPVGTKPDPRTIPLKDSIEWEVLSRTSGVWKATARHALPIEKGAVPHVIRGNPFLHFYWDNAGRWWVPGLFGPTDIVNHPGNAAQPYLRPAYEIIMGRIMSIAREEYPG